MTDPISIEADALDLLTDAIAPDEAPALTSDEVDRLLEAARSEDDGGGDIWYVADLNAAAARGWRMKMARVAGKYDIGVGSGKTFNRSQAFHLCRQMAADYASGRASVAPSADTTPAAIESITLTSVAYEDYEA